MELMSHFHHITPGLCILIGSMVTWLHAQNKLNPVSKLTVTIPSYGAVQLIFLPDPNFPNQTFTFKVRPKYGRFRWETRQGSPPQSRGHGFVEVILGRLNSESDYQCRVVATALDQYAQQKIEFTTLKEPVVSLKINMTEADTPWQGKGGLTDQDTLYLDVIVALDIRSHSISEGDQLWLNLIPEGAAKPNLSKISPVCRRENTWVGSNYCQSPQPFLFHIKISLQPVVWEKRVQLNIQYKYHNFREYQDPITSTTLDLPRMCNSAELKIDRETRLLARSVYDVSLPRTTEPEWSVLLCLTTRDAQGKLAVLERSVVRQDDPNTVRSTEVDLECVSVIVNNDDMGKTFLYTFADKALSCGKNGRFRFIPRIPSRRRSQANAGVSVTHVGASRPWCGVKGSNLISVLICALLGALANSE